MLHSSSSLECFIVDIKKILQHGNARFISLLLLTGAVSNSHTEAFSGSMWGKQFETCLLPTAFVYKLHYS
jgi:hypothetical protein